MLSQETVKKIKSVCFFVKQKRLPFSEALISAPRRSKCIFRQCSYLNLPLFELACNLIYYYNTLSYQICQMFLFFCVETKIPVNAISFPYFQSGVAAVPPASFH